MTTKRCPKCVTTKSHSEFNNNKCKRDGLSSWCKVCLYALAKEKQYDAGRKDYFRKKQREYNGTEEHRARMRAYRKSAQAKPEAVATRLWASANSRARARNILMTIDTDWLYERLLPMKCEATGLRLVYDVDERYNKTPLRPSLDRIDPKQGYTPENSRIVCAMYNTAKADYDDDLMLVLAKAIVEKNNGTIPRNAVRFSKDGLKRAVA